MKLWIFFTLFLTPLSCLLSQQPQLPAEQIKNLENRIQNLEARFAALEDYIKTQLELMLEQKAQEINKNTVNWQQELAQTKEKLQQAQAEILRLKVAIAHLQRGEAGTPVSLVATPDSSSPDGVSNPDQPATNNGIAPSSSAPDSALASSDPQLNRWITQLRSPESSLRIAAVLQLSRSEKEEATHALIAALQDNDPYVRMMICRSLGKRKAQAAIPGLLDLQLDSNLDIRTFAAQALQEITQSTTAFPYRGNDAERKRAIADWRKKWCKE